MTINMNNDYILARCLIKNYKGDYSEAPSNYAETFTVNISAKTNTGITQISDKNFNKFEDALKFIIEMKSKYDNVIIDNNTSEDFKFELENIHAAA